jgi:ATP-dependent DNA ligase
MRTKHPDESQLMFLAFDLLHQDGVDLRGLPLTERTRDLRRLCAKAQVPFMSQVHLSRRSSPVRSLQPLRLQTTDLALCKRLQSQLD